jgi:phospholipid/cholesterol/gamma-HCH transport system permease protein
MEQRSSNAYNVARLSCNASLQQAELRRRRAESMKVPGNSSLVLSGSVISCAGEWIGAQIDRVERELERMTWPDTALTFDLGRVERMDTCGAWLLQRTISRLQSAGTPVLVSGANEQVQSLLELVAARQSGVRFLPAAHKPGTVESIGRHVFVQLKQYMAFLSFIGHVASTSLQLLRRPQRVRFGLLVDELEAAGVHALPIVGLLSFLLGIVIAYQGGIVLQDYGAAIYIADIVGLSTVRELAPLITAIIVAGRTGSAYTAQIGTMMVTDEVNALRSVGISPIEALVVPKMLALIIALPLLTLFADFMGILGGLVMSATMLNLNAVTYIDRLAEALTLQSYLSGIGKAPVFAALIAIVGCFQGFQVSGSAASVGRKTTISVVQSIFLVLIVDALFSIAFSELGI